MAIPGLRLLRNGCARIAGRWRAVATRPFWRVTWNPDPGAEIIQAGRVHRLGPGLVLLVPPATPIEHRLVRGPVRTLFAHAQAGQPWDAWSGRVWALPAARFGRRWLEDLVRRAEAEGQARSPVTALQFQLLALRALVYAAESGPPPTPQDPLVTALRAAVEAEPGRDWSVEAVAAQAGQSVRTLQRRLRAAGAAPRTLLWSARLAAAADQLADTGLPIEDIAQTCGFTDRHHLTRRFTAAFGCGPATYRRRPW